MRRVLPIFAVLVACQSVPEVETVYDHCAIFNPKNWDVVTLEDSLSESLISMAHRDSDFKEAMDFEGKRTNDVWFKNSEGDLKLCRYESIEDSCSSKSVTLKFKLLEGSYQPEQVMEKICMVHSYHT